jgi:hypothetical protein
MLLEGTPLTSRFDRHQSKEGNNNLLERTHDTPVSRPSKTAIFLDSNCSHALGVQTHQKYVTFSETMMLIEVT